MLQSDGRLRQVRSYLFNQYFGIFALNDDLSLLTYSFLYLSDHLIEIFVFTNKEKQIQFISDVDTFLAKDFFVCVCTYTVSCVYNRVLLGLAI